MPLKVKSTIRNFSRLVEAAAKGESVLSSRLLVLDHGSIRPCFSKKLSELVGLRARLLGKGEKASAGNTATLLKAKGRVSGRKSLLKKMKQLILENDRRKKGVGDSEV